MGRSRRINEQNDKRSNVPISKTRSKKYKKKYNFEIIYCEKHQKHFSKLFCILHVCMNNNMMV